MMKAKKMKTLSALRVLVLFLC